MLVVISPAKKMDWSERDVATTTPDFLEDAARLVDAARGLSVSDLKSLMSLSENLATLNRDRFQSYQEAPEPALTRPAALAFAGDTYQGLEAGSLDEEELAFAQDHLRILSGLYGVLRPLDAIQPYRLEMGTKFATARGSDLYAFWDGIINKDLNALLSSPDSVLLNLASNEYFKAAKEKTISSRIVTPVFMDNKDGKYKIISFFAKKARGLMAGFIIKNKIIHVESIKAFDSDGYSFNDAMSEGDKWVFTRG